jgi:hypothetical protein
VASYRVTLKDRTVELIDGADAYQQEGQMTTFFAVGDERRVVDCWSTRVASFRTSEILIIRRHGPDGGNTTTPAGSKYLSPPDTTMVEAPGRAALSASSSASHWPSKVR